MENHILSAISAQIIEYIGSEKDISVNESRKSVLVHALSIAHKIFPTASLSIESDPFQLVSIILSVKDFDLDITKAALMSFTDIISFADGFTIYPTSDHMLKLDIMFHDVLNITEKT